VAPLSAGLGYPSTSRPSPPPPPPPPPPHPTYPTTALRRSPCARAPRGGARRRTRPHPASLPDKRCMDRLGATGGDGGTDGGEDGIWRTWTWRTSLWLATWLLGSRVGQWAYLCTPSTNCICTLLSTFLQGIFLPSWCCTLTASLCYLPSTRHTPGTFAASQHAALTPLQTPTGTRSANNSFGHSISFTSATFSWPPRLWLLFSFFGLPLPAERLMGCVDCGGKRRQQGPCMRALQQICLPLLGLPACRLNARAVHIFIGSAPQRFSAAHLASPHHLGGGNTTRRFPHYAARCTAPGVRCLHRLLLFAGLPACCNAFCRATHSLTLHAMHATHRMHATCAHTTFHALARARANLPRATLLPP